MTCAGPIRRVSAASVLSVVMLATGCGASTPAASDPPTTVISFEPASTTVVASVAPTSEPSPALSSSPEPGAVTTTPTFDFGDLGHDGYCALAKDVVDATSALVPTATSDVVRSGLATMKDSLGSLAAKGAPPQRPQFAAAVAVLDKASVAIEANGYDVAKTQSQLSVLDPDGALVGAITIVLTQRQAACG